MKIIPKMKTFVISYDLRNADSDDYDELYDELEKLGGREVLESTWTLRLPCTWDCQSVAKRLYDTMDEDDGIYVVEIIDFCGTGYDNEPHQL